MKPRSTLFRKHLINFVVLAGFLLLASGTISLYFSWQDSRDAFLELQRMRAEAAADGIAQRLSGIVSQIGASAPSPATANDVASRTHDIGLLRQLPAISDVLLLDREGRELLRMPRAGSETAGSKTDYSRSAAFQQARVGQPYFSPVYLGADNEPRITIAMATAPEGTSIIVAEIDIRFLLDGLGRIASDGPVYVADAHGQVIALADPELKLQKTGLVLPAMDADAQAMVAPLGWKVAIAIPSGAALVPLPVLAARSAALMLIGLLAMAAAGIAMIRRAARQVSALQEEQEQAVRRAATHAQAAQEERQTAEQAHKRLLDMIDALPLAVYQFRETADGSSGFSFVGKSAREVLGVDAAEIVADQQARWRTTLPEDRAVIEPVLQSARAARQPAEAYQRVQIGGATRWIRACAAAPRLIDGDWVWNGCWLDETSARRREEEMQRGRDDAENLARARSAFLCNISQEIRAPLDAIIGLSQRALKDDLAAPQVDRISNIHQAATGLAGVLSNILDFARIDAGKLVLAFDRFRLDHVIDKVAAATGPAAAGKGLALTFSVPQNIPRALCGDPLRLEQILVNLADNAVRFTERGEVAVRVERVYSTDTHVTLRFVVRDTGIGIPTGQRERLFEIPLREGHGQAHGGIGLGLIICKRLVDMMGGAIAVESRLGVGSTFCFTARFGLDTTGAQPPALPAYDDASGRPGATQEFAHAAVSCLAPADSRAAGRISKETFQQLVGYLSSGDRFALDCFAEHRDELASALGRRVEHLEQAIGRSDFETALGLLDKVMTRLDFGFGR